MAYKKISLLILLLVILISCKEKGLPENDGLGTSLGEKPKSGNNGKDGKLEISKK